MLFKNFMYLKTTGAWSRSRVRRKTLSCPEAQGRVLFLQSWSVDWKSKEILNFTVLWDRSILSKQSIMLFIYCVIIPMKSCDCYSIIFATSVTDKSWLNLNLKVVLRMLLRMCLNLSFFFLNNKMEISSEHFILLDFLHIGETFNCEKCLKYLYKTGKGELEIPNWVKEVHVVILWNWTKSTSITLSFLCARSVN